MPTSIIMHDTSARIKPAAPPPTTAPATDTGKAVPAAPLPRKLTDREADELLRVFFSMSDRIDALESRVADLERQQNGGAA